MGFGLLGFWVWELWFLGFFVVVIIQIFRCFGVLGCFDCFEGFDVFRWSFGCFCGFWCCLCLNFGFGCLGLDLPGLLVCELA